MLPRASATLVPFLTAYYGCVLNYSFLLKMTPRYLASLDGLIIASLVEMLALVAL
jgi:hypothetical protein